MSDENIIEFPGDTLLDIAPEKILEGALATDLSNVVLIGTRLDGSIYLASSTGDLPLMLWFLELAKAEVMDMGRE